MTTNHIVYKDPNDVTPFSLDWSDVLASGETISTSAFSAESGITVDSNSNSDTGTTVWLSSGTAGTDYKVYNTITTSASRTIRRFIQVSVDNLDA